MTLLPFLSPLSLMSPRLRSFAAFFARFFAPLRRCRFTLYIVNVTDADALSRCAAAATTTFVIDIAAAIAQMPFVVSQHFAFRAFPPSQRYAAAAACRFHYTPLFTPRC